MNNCIHIGPTSEAKSDYEFSVAIGEINMRTSMAPDEFVVVSAVVRRAIAEARRDSDQ